MRQQVSSPKIDKYLQPSSTADQPDISTHLSLPSRPSYFTLPYLVETRKHDAPHPQQDNRRTSDGTSIERLEEPLSNDLKPNEALIKIHAVSLNFRDIAIISGRYPVEVIKQGVPCPDAAVTVVAVGSNVKKVKIGDYVTPSFQTNYVTGTEKHNDMSALGGDVDGVLREYAVFEADILTKVPDHLSYEEASTIACAGVTAWTALDMGRSLKAESALMQGAGGVSMFALIICVAAGIKPIITSSSYDKLKEIKKLRSQENPVIGINYGTHPDWDVEAKRLTEGLGIDVVVNNVGITAMEKSINLLVRRNGTVSVVGLLGGFPDQSEMPDCILPLMKKVAKTVGIAVGSTKDQQDLCDFLAEHKVDLRPIVDKKTFGFEDALKAFEYLDPGKHTGNVVIRF